MALRQDKDRAKAQQEKFQAILSAMLKDEDNKYCEDCDAKGPRWASWNLGIFLCIRCAGIHRNLGVHISKVKSVNLDTWTAEQVAMMQEMGNSRARAVYEANVPDDFRRPQTNSAVEAFIRSKYENKKYIAREWVPPKPVVPKEWFEDDKVEKKKPRSKPTPSASANSSAVSSTVSVERRGSNAKPAPPRAPEPKPAPAPQPAKVSSGSADLLGLDTEIAQPAGTGVQGGDLLSDLFGATPSVSAGQTPQPNTAPPQQNGFAEPNLFEKGNDSSSSGGGEQGDKKSTKDSIMALYGSGGAQPQMFGVPGVVPISRPQDGDSRSPSAWTNNPFLVPEASIYGTCYTAPGPYCYSTAGGMYMPQQQMYGPGGMAPMMQQPQMMMGMQPGMMGQPMQQGMMGMPQMSGAMYGMGGGGMMGGGQGMMMGGAGFMQQQASQPSMAQQLNPMQQQMHFQQMQQQMASMALGGGSQTMGLQQQPQQTAVGAGVGGAWGGQATGHTLSNTLWQ
ncbi:stromal membrane-associated protein 1-like isoform X2 [Babylonia areolata]|uniref:stromal membrane-associated protein 1-like isoform X2 n=1 Tax=Babylonia areolata TaxID=304850 RepID=UPI003FD3F9CE